MKLYKYYKDGLEYLRTTVTVHGKDVVIEGQIAPNDNNSIWYEGFRSMDIHGEKVYIGANVLVEDYFTDISFLLKYLDSLPFKIDNLYLGLFEQITNHVKKYRRIINEDLYTYLDYCILVQNFLSVSHGLKYIDKVEGEKIFNETKNACYKHFIDYVWVSVPDQLTSYKLVQLRDLIEQNKIEESAEKLDPYIISKLKSSNGQRVVMMIEMLDNMHFPEGTFKGKEIREMKNEELKTYKPFYGDLTVTEFSIKITNRISKYPKIEDTESDFEIIVEKEDNKLMAKYYSFENNSGLKFHINGFKFFGINT